MTDTRTLQLDLITIDNSLNPRNGALDQEKVVEYKENLDNLPPMHVFEIGGGYILTAGFHRIAAHRLAGREEAEFLVHQGTREEAAEFADLDNLSHGINLTRDEKRAVAERQLCRHPQWADSRIARSCYTTDKTIRKIREELEATGRIEVHDRLVGSDGIERPRHIERAEPATLTSTVSGNLASSIEPDTEPELEAIVAKHRAAGSNTPLNDAISELDNEALLEDPDIVARIEEELDEAGLADLECETCKGTGICQTCTGSGMDPNDRHNYCPTCANASGECPDCEEDSDLYVKLKYDPLRCLNCSADAVRMSPLPGSILKCGECGEEWHNLAEYRQAADPHARANAQLDALSGATPLQHAAEMTKPIGTPPAGEETSTTPPKPEPEPAAPPPPPPPPPVVGDAPVRVSITIQPGPELARRAAVLSLSEGEAQPLTVGVLYQELLSRLQVMLEQHFSPPASAPPPPPSVSEPADVPEAEPEWLVGK